MRFINKMNLINAINDVNKNNLEVIKMDNYNPNLHKKESQLAFAMGVFETKMQYKIGDDDDIFDEFMQRLYEIGEYNIHHKVWMEELHDMIYDKDNILCDDVNIYQEYEDAVEQFKLIEDFIQRGCVAI